MKYIVLKTPDGDAPILFPDSLVHSDVAAKLGPLTVVSAGFVRWSAEGIRCYGHSASLRIGSRGAIDAALVLRQLQDTADA